MAEQDRSPCGDGAGERGASLREVGQVVLALQGGGALGAYQAGVYQALADAALEPDWVVGTSIGAINGALIAGNRPGARLDALKEFWRRLEYEWPLAAARMLPFVGQTTANWLTMAGGNPHFFAPNPFALLDLQMPLGPEVAAFYSLDPLVRTLDELIEYDEIRREPTRLTVGVAKVTTSELIYFDSARMDLTLKHIVASGALPPAFPAVRVDGELFWDGGVLSNTPLEIIFDEVPRRSALVFAVQLWNPNGPEPKSLWDVFTREKDIRYSSRTREEIMRHKQLHRLRHIIAELSKRLPECDAQSEQLRHEGCLTRMHIVRLTAPRLEHEDYSKDIDFSPSGIQARWSAGFEDMTRLLEAEPWKNEVDPLEGVVLHDAHAGTMLGSS